MARRIVLQYYVINILVSCASAFTTATYVLYLKHYGLDAFERNAVNVTFFLSIFVFEVPTGVIADVFGRKASFLCAWILLAVCEIIYGCSASVTGFLVAECIGGIGRTCASGAFQAWFVDSMRQHRFHGSLQPMMGRVQLYSHVASAVGAIIGSYGSGWLLPFPFFAAAILHIVAALYVVMKVVDDRYRTKFNFREQISEFVDVGRRGVLQIRNSSAIRFVIVVGMIQAASMQSPNMQWSVYFEEYLPKESLGYFAALINLCMAFGAYIGLKFLLIIKSEKTALVLIQAFIGVTVSIALLFGSFYVMLCFFLLHEIGRGMYKPIKDAYLNHYIDSGERATVLSFESQFTHLAGVVGLLLGGLLARYFSYAVAWFISGVFLVVTTLLYWKNGNDSTRSSG